MTDFSWVISDSTANPLQKEIHYYMYVDGKRAKGFYLASSVQPSGWIVRSPDVNRSVSAHQTLEVLPLLHAKMKCEQVWKMNPHLR